jgi:Uma2 family endonuclease
MRIASPLHLFSQEALDRPHVQEKAAPRIGKKSAAAHGDKDRMAVSFKPLDPITDDDIVALSHRNPGITFERDKDGELLVSPTGGASSARCAELARQVKAWNDVLATPGIVFESSAGFKLTESILYAPDVAWIERQKWNTLTPAQREMFLPFAPTIAIEVLSRTDNLDTAHHKMQTYLEHGTKLGILIDPYNKLWHLYLSGQMPILGGSSTILSLPPLPEHLSFAPGFRLDLARVYTI